MNNTDFRTCPNDWLISYPSNELSTMLGSTFRKWSIRMQQRLLAFLTCTTYSSFHSELSHTSSAMYPPHMLLKSQWWLDRQRACSPSAWWCVQHCCHNQPQRMKPSRIEPPDRESVMIVSWLFKFVMLRDAWLQIAFDWTGRFLLCQWLSSIASALNPVVLLLRQEDRNIEFASSAHAWYLSNHK